MDQNFSPSRQERAGIGFRTPHFADMIATRPPVGFLEVHAENYMGGGTPPRQLETLRGSWPVSLHGVGLSLGSAEGLNLRHLERLAALVDRIQPLFVSEHLSWSVSGGLYLNDLLPLPYTQESLAVVAGNVQRLQDRLRRPVLIENPSAYLRFAYAEMTEAQFLAALCQRTGCGLLFDVNNVFVTCANLGGTPSEWLDALPADAVAELHLAGHCINHADDGSRILIDDHGSPVATAVWDLYARAVQCFPRALTLIEWDSHLPELPVLLAEADEADRRRASAVGEVRHAVAA
jgi:uncharacterized protein (UPF0276 family)